MKNILVPTDFSPEAHHAYEVALQLAKHTGGNVTLLYVLEGQEPAETGNFSTFGAPVHGGIVPNSGDDGSGMEGLFTLKLMQATKHRMHVLKDEATTLAADVPVLDTVEIADLSDGILAAIQKHGSDLVVMGVQNHGGGENFFLGSHVERTIRQAPCPVLVVKPPQAAFEVRTIVFPSDFSADADSAFAGLQPLLTAFPEATLHLLHVATTGNDEEAKQQMQAFATRHQLTHYQAASVQADEVSAGIEKYAQQVQADLVVLPTYHHSGLSSFLHAGIADTVATHALPPVLTYHFAQLDSQRRMGSQAMTVQAGCPLYSTADVLMATAHEPEIPGLAAATYLAGTADELQALLTKAVNQEGNIHAARIRDALDRLGQ